MRQSRSSAALPFVCVRSYRITLCFGCMNVLHQYEPSETPGGNGKISGDPALLCLLLHLRILERFGIIFPSEEKSG